MNIAIIGLGLIGGSMAKAIKKNTDHTVFGLDISAPSVQKALSEGAIDAEITDDFRHIDLLILALFPRDTVAFVETHAHTFREGCTIVDLCGVKRVVCDGIEAALEGRDITFIGGHPMAGREFWGYTASKEDLFQGSSMILTPKLEIPALKVAEICEFFYALGFGHIQIATPEHHDEVIAFTSQLAHVLSSAYVQCPTARQHMGFSAGSFQDLTRVAKLNEHMWTELFLLNSDLLAHQIDELVDSLTEFRAAIGEQDEERLFDLLRSGREIKEDLILQKEANAKQRAARR